MGLKKDVAEKGLEVATDLVKNNATNVLGMLFPYAGLKKKAVEMRMEQIKKSNLPDETKQSMVLNMRKDLKRIKNQNAIAEIAFNNAEKGTDFSEKSGVNDEWFERFMDAAKFVSSEDMQLIWGKILAGEFEKPGSTPPNMIRILSEITSELAQAFQKICSMKITICPVDADGRVKKELLKNTLLVPYNNNKKELSDIGLSFRLLNELDTLGVIKFNLLGKYFTKDFSIGMYIICIYNENYKIRNNSNDFPLGYVMLTNVGKALQQITEPLEIDGYYDMVKEYLIENGVQFADINDYIIEEKDGRITVTKKNET